MFMCENTNKKELPYSTMKMFLDPRLKLVDKNLYIIIHYLLLTKNKDKTSSLSKEYIRYKSGLNMFKFNRAWQRLKEAGYLVVERSYDHTNKHTVFLFSLKGTSCVKNMDVYLELITQFDKAYLPATITTSHYPEVIRKSQKALEFSKKSIERVLGMSFPSSQSGGTYCRGDENIILQNVIKLIAASAVVCKNFDSPYDEIEFDNRNPWDKEDIVFFKTLESGLRKAVKVN